jgi:hypothetical protein
MQGIYTYIPEKNHVPKENNVAAILLLLFMVPISLDPALDLMYFYISTFRCVIVIIITNIIVTIMVLPSYMLLYYLISFLCCTCVWTEIESSTRNLDVESSTNLCLSFLLRDFFNLCDLCCVYFVLFIQLAIDLLK